MTSDAFDRREGRALFGSDPAAYDAARPGHSEHVYEVLRRRCGLAAGTRVLEIGAGTGQATRRLLELGATPLVAVEPDPALARFLEQTLGDAVQVRVAALEDAELEPNEFDLTAAASSFHWVDEDVGLEKLFAALRPGGWIALWWTLFGESDAPDAFILATSPLLDGLQASPSRTRGARAPHALDVEGRTRALSTTGFLDVEHELDRWQASWDTAGIRALYGTFSPIARLDDARRSDLLDAIARIADEDFGGRVERTLATSLYTARKPE